MQLKYEITPENLKNLEIKQIFLDKDKFGVLTFDRSYPVAQATRKMLVELEDLGYKEVLTRSEIQAIESDTQHLVNLIREVSNKNPANDPSFNINVRNDLENNIVASSEGIQQRSRDKLVFLRQELALSKPESQDLQKEQKELSKIRIEYEKALLDLKVRFDALNEKKEEIENTQGEIAATRFGKHFDAQSTEYETQANDWLEKRDAVLRILFGVIGANFIVYFYLFLAWKLSWWPHFAPSDFFTVDYAVIKVTLVLLLSHVLAFNSKNYSISRNLMVRNKHRKNVADTINNFLESNSDSETKSQIIKQGAESMFKAEESGYLGKINQKDHSPIEQVTYILPNKKE